MKNRIGEIVLALLCLGLGIALIAVWVQSSKEHQADTTSIGDYSNRVEKVEGVAAKLQKDLEEQKQTDQKAYMELNSNFLSASNKLARTAASFSQTAAELAKTRETLKEEQAEVTKRDSRIAELEKQNQDLDKQALDLSSSITNLNLQIAETQRKLVESNQDKAELGKQLDRLMKEKAEMERQFNDLAVLRAQVSKIKEEIVTARRIDWIRQGVYANADEKGAQQLMQGISASQAPVKTTKPAHYDLNVEVRADGSVKVIPPITNAPPARP